MVTFSRTTSGLLNQFRFYRVPLFWVEGVNDVPQVERMLEGIPCKVRSAGTRSNCEHLIDHLVKDGHPYGVLVDGDMDVFSRKRSRHRRGLTLRRYSMESYFVDIEVVEEVCSRLAGERFRRGEIRRLYLRSASGLGGELRKLMVLDYVAWRCREDRSFFPKRAGRVLADAGLSIDATRFRGVSAQAPVQRGSAQFAELRRQAICAAGSVGCPYCIRGSFLYGIVVRLVRLGLKRCGVSLKIGDNELRSLFAAAAWERPKTKAHKDVKSRVRRAVREASRMLPTTS